VLEKPKSRRERIEEKYDTRLKEVSDTVSRLNEGLAARDRQIGELTGHLQALAQRPAYQPQYQAPPQQLPDPEEFERRAQEAIDRKDFTGYQRLTREASVAATLRALQPVFAAQRQQMQPQQDPDAIPPQLMPYFAAYPEVAVHPDHKNLLAAKNMELHARGIPPGPGRMKLVFDEVRAIVKGGQATGAPASYSRSNAAVLAGTPTSRPAGGSSAPEGKPRVELTQEERYFAKKAGFSELEIASEIAKSHPDRVLR